MSILNLFRSSKKALSAKEALETAIPAFPLMHDRHNYFLENINGDDHPYHIVSKAMLNSATSKAIQWGEYAHIIDGNEGLKMSSLAKSGSLDTLLPYFETNDTWPVQIKTLLAYDQQAEGILKVSVNGVAAIGFYDHLFFANAKTYAPNQTLQFAVSGLCYSLEIGESKSGFAENFCMYLPITTEVGGAEDEIRFLTRVDQLESFAFYGIPFLSIKVCLARANGFDMNTTLFIPKASAPDTLKVGDRISGMAWMSGYLASNP